MPVKVNGSVFVLFDIVLITETCGSLNSFEYAVASEEMPNDDFVLSSKVEVDNTPSFVSRATFDIIKKQNK